MTPGDMGTIFQGRIAILVRNSEQWSKCGLIFLRIRPIIIVKVLLVKYNILEEVYNHDTKNSKNKEN